MSVTALNARRKRILQAIVEAYIETASAISSQTIVRRLRWQLSAATVRNAMMELDELGLVWQPHTSAGRIPTDKGYRYYINSLLEPSYLTAQEREVLAGQPLSQSQAFDELLTGLLRILSNFSGYTALAFSSGLRRIAFKRLELVSMHSTKLLVVLVSQAGLVKTALIEMPYKVEQAELHKIAKFLNEEFTELTLSEIKERLSQKILATSDAFFHLFKKAAQIMELAFANFDKDKLYLEGTSCILEQPEFHDLRKFQAILRVFDQQQPLLEIMREALESDGVKVHIGRENPYEDIQECSLVISNFKIRNSNMGTLGIIGPRRMSYPKVISTVGYAAQVLGERINQVQLIEELCVQR